MRLSASIIFAERFSMEPKAAYRFLSKYRGIDFLIKHYEIEHALILDGAIVGLEMICRQNGGVVQ